ncbi:helix-turn-helix transcriptional regulator [Streptomyces hydrogenans]|uniref:helix-turn-helix transcriptional regulator n=1 Tax=Streptomyces hydrogenans TaxID=1873719 RepID=UPI00343C18D1
MTTTAVENPSPVTVRTAELACLEKLLDAAEARRSAVAEIASDPGTGKSRLLTALARLAERRGVRVLRGRCAEGAPALAHGPVVQAFSAWRGQGEDDPATSPADALLALLARTPGEEDHRAAAAGHCAYHEEARRLLAACLADAPGGVLLILDDYHWADPGTAGLLDTLIHQPLPAGLVVAVAHRPRQTPAGLRALLQEGVEQGLVHLVQLPALDPEQSAAVLRTDPGAPGLARLTERAGGVPLYLLALAEEEREPLAGVRPATATGRLAVHLHTELEPLDETALTVVRAAAVLGDTFTVDTVAEVAAADRSRTCAVLGELRRRDLVRPTGEPDRLTFRHPLLRQALYATTDACWRAGAHVRALAALRALGAPALELAPHIERAGAAAGEADRRDLGTAARIALHLGRPAAAAHWLTVALRIDRAVARATDARPARGRGGASGTEELWREVVRHLAAAGDAERVARLVREILAGPAARTGPERSDTVAYLASVLAALGRDEEAQTLLAAELAAEPGPAPKAASLLQVRRQVAKVLAGQIPARADVERLTRLTAGAGPLAESGAFALSGLCAVLAGDTCAADRSLTAAGHLLDGLDEYGEPDPAGDFGGPAATGDFGGPDGPTAGPAPRDTAGTAGEPLSTLLLLLSWAEALMGWYGPAHGHAERALASARARGDAHLLPPLLDTLGYVHYQSGRMADALLAAAECREVAAAAGRDDHVGLSDAITAAAWAQLGRGNPAARRPRPGTEDPLKSPRTPLNSLLQAEAYLAAGDGEAALALLMPRREAWRVSEPVAVLAARGYELLAAAAVAADPDPAGVPTALIEEWAVHSAEAAAAVGIAEQSGHALMARGHALLRRRQGAEAAQAYAEAVELLGADSPAGTRARELARDLGGYPRGARGPDAPEPTLGELTVREREVAALAGEGRRTKDIALRLAVSPRTVDAHITRIYSKLGVNSRAELARLMALSD